MARAISTRYTTSLLQWIGSLTLSIMLKLTSISLKLNIVIERNMHFWRQRLTPYKRSARSIINTRMIQQPIMQRRYFFYKRSSTSFISNLITIKLKRVGFVVIQKILIIAVLKAQWRTSGLKNIRISLVENLLPLNQ